MARSTESLGYKAGVGERMHSWICRIRLNYGIQAELAFRTVLAYISGVVQSYPIFVALFTVNLFATPLKSISYNKIL